MTQIAPRSCPQCFTPVAPGQRFCSNCGATVDTNAMNLTTPSDPGQPQRTEMATQMATPPPPPIDPYGSGGMPPSYSGYTPPPTQDYAQSAAPGYVQTPSFTSPQKDSSGRVLGQIGCGMGIVILLILLVCGVSGYVGYRWITGLANSVPTASSTTQNGSTTNNGTQNGTQGPASVTTTQINSTITYRSVDLTILSVQQSTSFPDDTSTSSSPDVVRLQMREHNPTSTSVTMLFSDTARLILPDKTTVPPTNSNGIDSVPQAVTQTGWLDFPLSSNFKPDQLTLRLGTDAEAQMNIPLSANANLSQYKVKTVSPNKVLHYDGLNWTITSATLSWSANGTQAASGKRFVMLSLRIDNPTSNEFIAYYGNYMRLQAGDTTASPEISTDFTTNVAANSTGTTGNVLFTAPDNATSYTFILLANSSANPPINQATGTFQFS